MCKFDMFMFIQRRGQEPYTAVTNDRHKSKHRYIEGQIHKNSH